MYSVLLVGPSAEKIVKGWGLDGTFVVTPVIAHDTRRLMVGLLFAAVCDPKKVIASCYTGETLNLQLSYDGGFHIHTGYTFVMGLWERLKKKSVTQDYLIQVRYAVERDPNKPIPDELINLLKRIGATLSHLRINTDFLSTALREGAVTWRNDFAAMGFRHPDYEEGKTAERERVKMRLIESMKGRVYVPQWVSGQGREAVMVTLVEMQERELDKELEIDEMVGLALLPLARSRDEVIRYLRTEYKPKRDLLWRKVPRTTAYYESVLERHSDWRNRLRVRPTISLLKD